MRTLVLALVLTLLSAPGGAQTSERIRIVHENAPRLSVELRERGFDVLPGGGPVAVELIVSEGERSLLVEEGFALETLDVGKPLRERERERSEAAGLEAPPPGYPDLDQVYARMNAAVAANPSIATVVDLTAKYGTPPTVEGRHLFAVKISDNVQVEEDEPSFLMVSAHHSRELVTPEIALHHLEQLTQLYGSNPAVTAAVDSYEIWVAPLWNPDGYAYVFCCNDFWRKNRRDNGDGTWGVDLNRNYPFGWGSACSGSTSTISETYRGPGPASEPEVQTMQAFGSDRRFTKLHDYHSFAAEVRYGYGCFSHPFDPWLQTEASKLSLAGGYNGSTASSCCTAGDIHWHGANFGTHAFLWETHTVFQPSYASAQAEAVKVWPGALQMLERPIPLWGHVVDACTGQPLEADLSFPGVSFVNGETNGSGGTFGRYHAFLPAGSYTARFSASGYATQDHPVVITANGSLRLEVALAPLGSTAVSYCTAGTSASGCQAVLSAAGTASATAASGFVLSAEDVEGSKDGLFFFAANGRQANPWGNGSSFQCVVPPVIRAGLLVANGSSGACDGTFSQDLNALWCPTCPKPLKNPGAGAVVQAQLWYRDPASSSNQTTSLSDAIEFGVCP